MRTQQLSVMVKNLRAEAGHALSVAQGVNQYDTLKYLLARTQEELWTAFVWPDLMVRANVAMAAGQYLYSFPSTPVAMTYDMIRETWASTADSTSWVPLAYGIDEDMIDPSGANTSRADPIQAWDVEGPNGFRVWPTPDAPGGNIRFKGMQQLAPFIADSDLCTLDATAIILFTAADLLARAKAEDAATKMQKAQRHITKVLGNKINAKNKISTLGGGTPVGLHRVNVNLINGPG
jgi:hypothetical protein